MDILETLRTLNACHGPSGNEGAVSAAIECLARPFVDTLVRDSLGNLIAHKKGTGSKILFAAHMDSIGFIVTHIDEKGFLRFGRLGGLRAHSCIHTVVRFQNGVQGVVCLDGAVEPKNMKLDDLYIDIGAANKEEAQSLVHLGDTAVYDAAPFAAGNKLISPYLDNRISCVTLLLALEQLQASEHDLYFVFTVQEELGMRGAKTAAYGIDPDYAMAIDVTWSDDELGAKHTGSSVQGGGAAIKVMDGSIICHPQMVSRLEDLALKRGITYQRDVIRSGGTDAGAIHQTRSGVQTGGVSIPCRYMHSPVEMVDRRDVEACAALIVAAAEEGLA